MLMFILLHNTLTNAPGT